MKLLSHLFLLSLFFSCGKPITEHKETTDSSIDHEGVSDEILLETEMFHNFDLLPLNGKVDLKNKYWSGDSWKLNQGSINYRWNDNIPSGKYLSPTSREVMTMNVSSISKLSPSEKYDLYMGRYDYPLKNEVQFFSAQGTLDWEGLCHGWAAASTLHSEPEEVEGINPDGVRIPFGSSDLKALLTYAYSKVILSDEQIVGKRCDYKTTLDEDCDGDLSAMSFHLVTANKIGLRGQSYIADIDHLAEVWNHPVIGFDSKIESKKSFRTGKLVTLSTKLTYVDLSSRNSWTPVPRMFGYQTVKYELELDKENNVVGGKWIGKDRPDFIWGLKRAEVFTGYFENLRYLLK